MFFDLILSDASAAASLGYIRYIQGFIAHTLLLPSNCMICLSVYVYI